MNKICITGEDGFLGYHLTNFYKKKYKIVKLGKKFLTNIHQAEGCEFLIHAAGVNRDPDPNFVYHENLEITKNLIKKLESLNIKINIKFISTVKIKDNSLYSKSKIESEKLLKNYCDRSKTKLEVYYLPNLFGTHGKPYYNSVVNTFCFNICNSLPSNISDNTIKLCYVYDAIKVINNETDNYELTEISVGALYDTLVKLKNSTNDLGSAFEKNLKEILSYYENNKFKVLVLGHKGMLGSMVVKYFNHLGLNVVVTDLKYPEEQFFRFIKNFKGDFIINCIGSIPQKVKNFKINTDLPIWLSNNVDCYVVHPGTDCELDSYSYGLSKKIASEYIKMYSTNTKIIMTSIVGHEMGTKHSLLEWFLSQEGEVDGHCNAIWNGITTLEWSKQCYNIMLNWKNTKKLTTIASQTISKYDLLNIFSKIYGKKIKINKVEKGHDRSLSPDIVTKSIEEQLIEMKEFYERTN